MRRLIVFACLIASGLTIAPQADAGELAHRAWHGFWTGHYRNKHWPEPFQTLDRHSVMRPMEIMKNNGWRLENTLHDALFNVENNELTRAAELKIHLIATQAPMARRTVFIYGTDNDPNTQSRMAAVQSYITQLYPGGDGPAVMITTTRPISSSGDVYNRVINGYRDSIPAPVLPGAGGGVAAGSQ